MAYTAHLWDTELTAHPPGGQCSSGGWMEKGVESGQDAAHLPLAVEKLSWHSPGAKLSQWRGWDGLCENQAECLALLMTIIEWDLHRP